MFLIGWRPPQGDVDDRLRSIAWQMGMRTILWDWDTNDWDMPAPGGGNLSPSTVDGYFKKWIESEKSGSEKTGHIVLEHELNSATVGMTEKWLPIIQKEFNVIPASACNGITQPYWEQNMVYPLENTPVGGSSNSTDTQPAASNNTTVASTATSSGIASATISSDSGMTTSESSSSTNINLEPSATVSSDSEMITSESSSSTQPSTTDINPSN